MDSETSQLLLVTFAVSRTVFSSFQEWANAIAQRPSSVRLSVRPSVCKLLRKSLLFADNGRIVTKLAHDGLQVSLHPGCVQGQGQGQRSHDTRTFLDSWNELLRHWRSALEIWCDITKVLDSRITWKLSCGHVCKMFGRQWPNEPKITIFNDHTLIWRPLPS